MRTLLCLLTLSAVALAAPVPKVKAKDEEAILGRWKLIEVQLDEDGKRQLADEVEWKAEVYEFCDDGTLVSTHTGREPEKKSFKIDPATKPKQLTLYDKDRKEYAVAVYELNRDTFRLCLGSAWDAPRPTVVKADAKKSMHVLVFERVKEEK